MWLPLRLVCPAAGSKPQPQSTPTMPTTGRKRRTPIPADRLILNGGELLPRGESVASFQESQYVDVGLSLEQERIAELHRVFVVGTRIVAAYGIERSVVVTAHGDNVDTVHIIARHAVAADFEPFEGRYLVFIVMSQVSHFRAAISTRLPLRVSGVNHWPLSIHLWNSIQL